MSPSWRDRLSIDITAHDVVVRRYARGWRPQLLGEQRVKLQQATADGALQALAEALPASAGQPLHAQVVLSSDWVRYAVLDAAGALRGPAERAAAGRHALRRVFGEVAEGWRISATSAGRDSLVAAGIEEDLLAGIEQTVESGATVLTSVRPSLVSAFNRCRGGLDRPAWFVLLEPGRALQAFCDGRQLRSLRNHRVRRALHEELPEWIEQGRLLDGLADEETPVVVAYRGTPPPAVAALAGRLRLVDLDAAKAV